MIWDGAIRRVHTIHRLQTRIIPRSAIAKMKRSTNVPPAGWDFVAGPAASPAVLQPMYLPGNCGWSAFGTGTIGDWTCHVLDPFSGHSTCLASMIKARGKI